MQSQLRTSTESLLREYTPLAERFLSTGAHGHPSHTEEMGNKESGWTDMVLPLELGIASYLK